MKTIGVFYKEKILSLPRKSLKRVKIEDIWPEIVWVEEDLFGWKLKYKRFAKKIFIKVECRSEEEARYLKIFFERGAPDIFVPKSDDYLKEILPMLEKKAKRIDEIMDHYLCTIFNRKKRDMLRGQLYQEVMKTEEPEE